MRTRLGAAREQSRRFFWRVQLPALVFAALSQVAALCAVGIIAFSGHRDLSGVYIGLVLFGVGGFAICFAAEPWMARPAACSLCFCSAAASSIFAYLFVLYARSAPELLRAHRAGLGVVCRMVEDGQTIPCGLMPTMAVTAYAPALAMHFFVAANVRNVWRERMLPREVLEGMVRTGGYMYVLIALSSATRLATAAAYGVPVGSLLWKSTAACAVVVGALGVLMLAGVHEFMLGLLAQRGQAFSTAAGIAALLDGRDSTVVQALAVSRLRAVSAAAVTLEGLGSNTANVEFYALRAPASLGHVDAFVSHSWHDPPARKFDALQAWRADFVRTHKREPAVCETARAHARACWRALRALCVPLPHPARACARHAPATSRDRPVLHRPVVGQFDRRRPRLPAVLPRGLLAAAHPRGPDVAVAAVVHRRAHVVGPDARHVCQGCMGQGGRCRHRAAGREQVFAEVRGASG